MAMFKFPSSDPEWGDWGKDLLRSLISTGVGTALQAGISGGFQNYFENLKADRLREEMANQKGVEELASDTKAALLPAMGPIEYSKIAKLVRSNPEMAVEATPDWSGDKGRLLPKDNKIWMGKKRVSPEPSGAFITPTAMVGAEAEKTTGRIGQPFLKGIQKGAGAAAVPEVGLKENRVGIASPLEDWANRNPDVAEWANEPVAKRAMEQKGFLAQLQAGAKSALKDKELAFKGEQNRLTRAQDADQFNRKMQFEKDKLERQLKMQQHKIDTLKKDPAKRDAYERAKLYSTRSNTTFAAAWDPKKEMWNPDLLEKAYEYFNAADMVIQGQEPGILSDERDIAINAIKAAMAKTGGKMPEGDALEQAIQGYWEAKKPQPKAAQ